MREGNGFAVAPGESPPSDPEGVMTIRTFEAGDEVAQVSIYNEAAARLPKFKPATLDEVRRRCRAADFDPGTRFYAVADGRPVGYASFHANGRVSFLWCRPGHEAQAEPLFAAVLDELASGPRPRSGTSVRSSPTTRKRTCSLAQSVRAA